MRSLIFVLLLGFSSPSWAQKAPVYQEQEVAQQIGDIYDNILSHSSCYDWLHYLCKRIGGRIAGSAQDSAAARYTLAMLDSIGVDTAWLQPVEVSYWERGKVERSRLYCSNRDQFPLNISALGYSAPTPRGGLRAQVIEVQTIAELERLGTKVKGKIVFFNRPMDHTKINTFHAYGGAVDQRSSGPKKASELGAVACVVRSMTLKRDDVPHSGVTIFGNQNKIPAAALGILSAERLSQALKEDPKLELELELDCRNLPNRISHNVIAEIRGSEKPNEIMVVGGHIDAWDTGEGAHDDGAGCVQAMEVLHTFRRMKIRPRHTLRCVLFAAEENGIYGADVYAKWAINNPKEKHIFALESDAGGHTPVGFTMEALPDRQGPAFQRVKEWRPLLIPYGLYYLEPGGSAADVGRLRPTGAVLVGYRPDSQRYFDYHHSIHDRFETVHRRELELGAASMAVLVYLWDRYGLD